jgi:glutamine synthetase
MLRTTNNKDYFYDLFHESAKFGIEIEGHRAYSGCGRFLLGSSVLT